MIIKPPRLRKGDGIGIIAPAGPVTSTELRGGIDLLESLGYKLVFSSHLYHRNDYLAGSDDARLEDLHSMFDNGNIKAIFCARGGYGALRLLEMINFDLIRNNPKIIMGYSDITTLLLAIYQRTGLVTFHGPVVKELSRNQNQNLEPAIRLISSDRLLRVNLTGGTALRPGKAAGTLLGGNLSLICHLIGTPFMPSSRRSLLFIEERGEPLYRIDRMLTHLRLSGLLEGLSGLIAGRFEGCGEISHINQLLVNTVSDLGIPVIGGLPVGHGLENIALPLGVQAELDTERMMLSIMETCVKP